jgi:hypothetical protein
MNEHWLGFGPVGRATTPASLLPELVHGEHVMRRPIGITATPVGHANVLAWSRVAAICVVIAASAVAFP